MVRYVYGETCVLTMRVRSVVSVTRVDEKENIVSVFGWRT
jgi:hypothetical protein